jgi:hypothetical protein
MTNKFTLGLLVAVAVIAAYACGGESKPAAAPEPTAEPAMSAESPDGGMDEHTMPDAGMDGMK